MWRKPLILPMEVDCFSFLSLAKIFKCLKINLPLPSQHSTILQLHCYRANKFFVATLVKYIIGSHDGQHLVYTFYRKISNVDSDIMSLDLKVVPHFIQIGCDGTKHAFHIDIHLSILFSVFNDAVIVSKEDNLNFKAICVMCMVLTALNSKRLYVDKKNVF